MFTALLAPLLWVVCGTRKLRKMQPFLALESSLEILPSLVWAVLACCQAEVQGIFSYYFLIDSCTPVPVLVLKCGEIAACLWLHGLWSQLGIIFFFFSFANTNPGGWRWVCVLLLDMQAKISVVGPTWILSNCSLSCCPPLCGWSMCAYGGVEKNLHLWICSDWGINREWGMISQRAVQHSTWVCRSHQPAFFLWKHAFPVARNSPFPQEECFHLFIVCPEC